MTETIRDGRARVAPTTVLASPIARVLDDLYLTLHIGPMGFTLSLPLIGVASSGVTPTPRVIAALLAIGVAFHLFAYGLNDLIDLPLDRTEPQRSGDPLVRGVITPATLAMVAIAQLPIALALAWYIELPVRGVLALLIAFAGLAAYDVWGKRCSAPWLTDAIQGVGWGSLLLVGAATSEVTPAATFRMLAAILLYIQLINGVHGPLRDLPNDFRRGARTTAIALGARPDGAGVVIPRALVMYALLLHGMLLLIVAMCVRSATLNVQIAAAALGAGLSMLLHVGYRQRGDNTTLGLAGGLYVALSFATLVLAGAHNAAPAVQGALGWLVVLPAGLMFLRNARQRTTP